VAKEMALIMMTNQKIDCAGSASRARPYLVNRKDIMADRMVNPVMINGMMI
jgi:hypothetical protein